MKKAMLITLAVLLLLGAVGLTLYPLISNYINDKYQSVIRTEYFNEVSKIDEASIAEEQAAAQAYNDNLSLLRFQREAVQQASVDYNGVLNPDGSGVMGYVEIPRLNVSLPIFHGTSEDVLEQGVGHLVGSSLPIGGEGTHSVLTGHSGVAGKRLFSDLDQLAPGDVFYLHVLNEILAYQITEINTVLPHETELLVPVAGEDLCTLVTCYPYSVNTHRLLVRGSRIPYEAAQETIAAEEPEAPVKSTWQTQYVKGLAIGGGAALCIIILFCVVLWLRKRRRHGKA